MYGFHFKERSLPRGIFPRRSPGLHFARALITLRETAERGPKSFISMLNCRRFKASHSAQGIVNPAAAVLRSDVRAAANWYCTQIALATARTFNLWSEIVFDMKIVIQQILLSKPCIHTD